MKAIRLHRFGGPEVLQYEEVNLPPLQRGEVLIRNRAAGVNPIDWKTRSGGGARPFLGEPPITLGWECAGTVEAVADDVGDWKPGDRVFGVLNFPQEGGCYAEQVVARADQLAAMPDGLDPAVAAGLPIAGLTAWQALFDEGDLQPGHRVLVLAAAGGVGHLAVQLAKWRGAEVTGTASPANHDYLKRLGCDRVIDYRNEQIADSVAGMDLIVDGMGGQTGIDALACLKPGGVMVTLPTVTAAEVVAAATDLGLTATGMRVAQNSAQLADLARLAAEGTLELNVDKRFPLREAAEAHRYSESSHARGKIILEIEAE